MKGKTFLLSGSGGLTFQLGGPLVYKKTLILFVCVPMVIGKHNKDWSRIWIIMEEKKSFMFSFIDRIICLFVSNTLILHSMTKYLFLNNFFLLRQVDRGKPCIIYVCIPKGKLHSIFLVLSSTFLVLCHLEGKNIFFLI